MNSIDLAYIINQLLNFKLEENENEIEKKEFLYNNIYETLKIIKEINNCNDLKIKLLNTIKEIFTNYEIHQNNLGKKFNNYIIGINHNPNKKTLLKNPHDFLRLSCDNFEICKYELENNNNQINILRNIFLPIKNLNDFDSNYLELTEIIEEVKVIKKSDTSIDIEYNINSKTYINSILHNITKKTYIISDSYIDNFNEIGFNKILDIVYYNIEQNQLVPIDNISITRSSHYLNYVEVIKKYQAKEIKFLTKYNTKKGLNSIDDFEAPKENTICGKDANVYTTYMQSGNKIDTTLYDFLKEIDDDEEKNNLKRYYKKINEKIR